MYEGHEASLVTFHMNTLISLEKTVEQGRETMALAPNNNSCQETSQLQANESCYTSDGKYQVWDRVWGFWFPVYSRVVKQGDHGQVTGYPSGTTLSRALQSINPTPTPEGF